MTRVPRSQADIPTILVVDDQILYLRLLSNILGRKFSVLTASGGYEALNLLANLKQSGQIDTVHAVFLDILMPEMDGLSLLEILQDEYKDIRVVMCSGVNERETVIRCMELGAKDYILKPYQTDVVFRKLDKLDLLPTA